MGAGFDDDPESSTLGPVKLRFVRGGECNNPLKMKPFVPLVMLRPFNWLFCETTASLLLFPAEFWRARGGWRRRGPR